MSVARSVIDLGARASVLDAVDRVRSAPDVAELVLAVAAGAPVLRSAVFLEVLRRAAGSRRVALVTADARARSLAASVHVPAFASVAALERQELDPTEPLGKARRAAIVAVQPARPSRTRGLLVAATVIAALVVLAVVVAPTATVVVAPLSQSLGPLEYDLRAGPNGADITALTLSPAQLSAKIPGTATGSRTEDSKATGTVRFSNQTTNDIRIPKGTVVQTPDNIRFQTAEERVLPKSAITLLPPFVTFGTVDIPVEALVAGPTGNVPARRISIGQSPTVYTVENQQATSGGDSKKIPIVQLADYQLAASRVDAELRKQADAQLEAWKKQAQPGQTIYGPVVRSTGVTGASEIVGKELPPGNTAFEITATGTATGYSVANTEPGATALKLLSQAAASGFDVDTQGGIVDVIGTPTVADDGVHWRVRARASQYRRIDEAAIRQTLAGRSYGDVDAVVGARDLRLVRVSSWPGWWPRLPLLDSRIQIRAEAPTASAR